MDAQELLVLATHYYKDEDYANARESYLQVLELNPSNAVAYTNLGTCFFVQNLLNEAAECYLAANQVDSNYIQAIYNYAHLLLLQKKYAEGFVYYRTRHHEHIRGNKLGGVAYPPTQLQGNEDLRGKTLYISHEQGFGDTINFIRYLPHFEETGAKLLVYVPESMHKLFALSYSNVTFITPQSNITFDYNTPLLEAPYLFGTTYETIPFGEKYLHVDAQDLQNFRIKHDLNKSDVLKIGFNYQGSQGVDAVKNRSIELSLMLEYLEQIPDVKLYCLQYERSEADDILLKKQGITNLGSQIKDFYDTALMIESMDVIVSIDTSFLHLAGALGKKSFALLKYHPDWRWGLVEEQSNWYKNFTLIRQSKPHDWSGVLEEVVQRIKHG
ncbi:MAG: tetratricopeptide repeat protein [Campylobacterales bacterium]|nr:tetratricopeptide repeat protein [Campylobacterales bacterium]